MPILRKLLLPLGLALSLSAAADEAVIRKNLPQRLPEFPKIDEVAKTAIAGIWEVRIGHEVFYTDADGSHILQGELIDTKTKSNLTRQAHRQAHRDQVRRAAAERCNGDQAGQRLAPVGRVRRPQLRLLQALGTRTGGPQGRDDLHLPVPRAWDPIPRSSRARSGFEGRDEGLARVDARRRQSPRAMGQCDAAAVQRTTAFGQKYRINGTPALFFENGERVPGALSGADLAKRLDEARKSKG